MLVHVVMNSGKLGVVNCIMSYHWFRWVRNGVDPTDTLYLEQTHKFCLWTSAILWVKKRQQRNTSTLQQLCPYKISAIVKIVRYGCYFVWQKEWVICRMVSRMCSVRNMRFRAEILQQCMVIGTLFVTHGQVMQFRQDFLSNGQMVYLFSWSSIRLQNKPLKTRPKNPKDSLCFSKEKMSAKVI